MKSMNHWLTFSLQSPHLSVDAVKQQQQADPAAGLPLTVSSVNSLLLSKMSQPHGNSLGGYQGTADCYNSLRAGGDGGNSNSGQALDTIRSDGSLCIMEALSRSHSAAEHWPQLKPRAMQTEGVVQAHNLLTANQLSRLTGNAGGSDQQQMATSHYDMQANSAETRDGPKLEDFLGGASLGGQYSDRETQQQQLENLYYNASGGAPNYNAHHRDSSQSRINVNLPYSQQPAGGGSLHDVPPSFHVSYGGVADQASLTNNSAQGYEHPHGRAHAEQLQESNLLTSNRMHAQNLLQVALDQSGTAELLSDCTLQLPQGGSPSAGAGDSYGAVGLKTWLRHQAATDKAGGRSLNALATLQPLSLSMSAGSHQSSVTAPVHGAGQLMAESPTGPEPRKRGAGRAGSKEPSPRKSIDTFGQRTSVYRGVTRHRWTGRYEAHLWDNSCRKEGQTRKGRQVYLGGYDKEEKAAKAYDLAALKYWGPSTTINFPLGTYETELEEMKNMSRQEYVASLRRKSSGFSRGASVYRGVTRHHQHGRWQARIGRVAGNKDLYLGTYSTQEEAAEAYDIAAIKFRGINAVTNFDISRYDAARIQAAAVNGHHGQEAMKAAKEAELAAAAAGMSGDTGNTPTQSRAHNAVSQQTHSHSQQIDDQDQQHHTSSMHTGTPGSHLTSDNTGLSAQGGLTKNLHEWQMLYQQQAQQQQQQQQQQQTRNNWGSAATTGQEAAQQQHESQQRAHLGFSDSGMRAPTAGNPKFNTPSNGMLLRNLMGLEDRNGNGESSCSANQQALLGHGMPSSGSMISTSAYQGSEGRTLNSPPYSERAISNSAAYNNQQQQQQQQGSERGALVESPKNSVGESEEASSKSSAYDPVLQGDISRSVLYLSPASQGKLNSYDHTSPITSWINGNPTTVQGLSRQSNLSVGGHMGSGPIFASWNE